jgi:hypothetical protein
MPPITALDLISDAILEAGIFAAGEPLAAEDTAFGLSKLNRLLDAWNAEKLNIFAIDFNQYVLVPSVSPLTIGQAAIITSAAITGGVALYAAQNTFKLGQFVDIAGCLNAVFNVSGAFIIAATPTNFQVVSSNPDVAAQAQTTAKSVFTGNPIPTFATATQRPVKILSASIIQNGVKVSRPNIRDDDWWANNTVTQITSSVPTDLYYSPDFPNGQIFLWPIQSAPYILELETEVNLADIPDLTYPFFLPQGYRDAITYSLAESLCPSYDVPTAKVLMLAEAARRGKALIQGMNSTSPRIVTRDSGIPGGRGGGYFNWLNGETK